MHAPHLPSARMMPSVGALMDPGFLRRVVADAAAVDHSDVCPQPQTPGFLAMALRNTVLAVTLGLRRYVAASQAVVRKARGR